MSVDRAKLSVAFQAAGYKVYMYQTNDDNAAIIANGYFDAVYPYIRLNVGDMILAAIDLDGTAYPYFYIVSTDGGNGDIGVTGGPLTAAAAITLADAGAHFAAAEHTVELALQKLAKTIVIPIPRFTGWTKDGTDKTPVLPLMELPVAVRVKRVYGNLGTAPGADKTATFKLNTSELVAIAGTDTQGEAEALDIAVAANTDFVITVSETAAGAGANADLILIAQVDDGE